MRIRWMVVVCALTACGGGGTTPDGSAGGSGGTGGGAGGTGGGAGNCEVDATLTAAGALTGTRSAPAVVAAYTSTSDATGVILSAQFGTPFLAAWIVGFTGVPRVTTYTDTTAGVSCGVGVTDAADPTRAWGASKATAGTPDQGTCALTLTTAMFVQVLGPQTEYCVHGTLEATLPPQPGSTATDTVTLSASF
jgi:hypothetical protein